MCKEKGLCYSAFWKASGKGCNSLIFTAFQTRTYRRLLLKGQKGAGLKNKKLGKGEKPPFQCLTTRLNPKFLWDLKIERKKNLFETKPNLFTVN